MTQINNCPGTLATNHSSYSALCLRRMFDGKKTSHFLPYQSHQPTDEKEMAELIKQYVAAAPVALECFYLLVLFNFLFSNGDAHLKNFSLLETKAGDYQLSPAYDLTNSSIHVKDPELALKDGLFNDDYATASHEANSFFAYDDFYEFAIRIGLLKARVEKILGPFITEQPKVEMLIRRSFLDNETKERYYKAYKGRLKSLNYSFLGLR